MATRARKAQSQGNGGKQGQGYEATQSPNSSSFEAQVMFTRWRQGVGHQLLIWGKPTDGPTAQLPTSPLAD